MSWAEDMGDQQGSRTEVLRASPPMFESRLLDSLSRVHPVVPVLIFAPLIVVMAAWGLSMQSVPVSVGLAAGGYALWTLFEYWLHRLVFHFEPEQGLGARLHWIIHGVHHDHPNDPLRLVMPPAVSVPRDRKSTRLNSSHGYISYAVFCLKKKNNDKANTDA